MRLPAAAPRAVAYAAVLAALTVSGALAGTSGRIGATPDAPPSAPTGLRAAPGAGSGETHLEWSPVSGGSLYRVYARAASGQFWLLANVTAGAVGMTVPGKLAIVDAKHLWPWPSVKSPTSQRCYRVAALSTSGLEGPMSALVCAVPAGA